MNEQEMKSAVVSQITPRHLYEVAILIAAALIFHAYISTRENVAKVEQVRQDVAPIHAQADTDRKTAIAAENTNQSDLAKTLAAIAAQKQQPISTPVDYDRIAAMIESRIGGPAQVQTTPGLPDAPSATVSAVKLRDFVSDCDKTNAELKSCKLSVSDVTTLLNAEVSDHAATKQELKVTKTALKGGSFLHRLKSNGKWMLFGAAAGAVAVSVTKR